MTSTDSRTGTTGGRRIAVGARLAALSLLSFLGVAGVYLVTVHTARGQEIENALASVRLLLDPDAPIAVELQTTLRTLGDAARATRALFELLGHDPSALLRGKSTEAEPSR